MSRRYRKYGLTRHALILGLVISIGAAGASAAFKYTAVGMEAFNFSGQDILSGNKISLKDISQDNLVIVVFWATWSPRSVSQLMEMKELKAEYADYNVEVIAVNVDAPEVTASARSQIVDMVKEMNLQFPILIDDGLEIFYTFGVIAVPSTAIVDTVGILRYDPAGYGLMVRDIIKDSVRAYLGLGLDASEMGLSRKYQPETKSMRYYNLGLNLFKQGMHNRALDNLDLAHQFDTLFPAPLILKAEILFQQEKLNEADSVFNRAATVDSTGPVAWAGWGRTLMQAGQTDAAKEKLAYALSIDDSYTPALIDLGLCLARQDSLETAVVLLVKACELNQGDPLIYYYLGQVYLKAGQKKDAVLAYLKALSLIYPDD